MCIRDRTSDVTKLVRIRIHRMRILTFKIRRKPGTDHLCPRPVNKGSVDKHPCSRLTFPTRENRPSTHIVCPTLNTWRAVFSDWHQSWYDSCISRTPLCRTRQSFLWVFGCLVTQVVFLAFVVCVQYPEVVVHVKELLLLLPLSVMNLWHSSALC